MMENKDPKHIALIMDGNGRWAEKHGLERVEGHRKGAEAVHSLLLNIKNYQTQYITLYAFSTENWKRSTEEVHALMSLLCEFIDIYTDEFVENKLRLLVTGRLDGMPTECRERLNYVIQKTSVCFERTLILALNYGGRAEILDSVKKIGSMLLDGSINMEDVTEELIGQNLYLPEIPDPDLLIRTSGEMRISNFLLWQISYSEIYFTDVFWPDFDDKELRKAIDSYKNRQRRFGGRK